MFSSPMFRSPRSTRQYNSGADAIALPISPGQRRSARSSRTRWPKSIRGSELRTLWPWCIADHYESTHEQWDALPPGRQSPMLFAGVWKRYERRSQDRRQTPDPFLRSHRTRSSSLIDRRTGLGPYRDHRRCGSIPTPLRSAAMHSGNVPASHPSRPPLGEFPF
jgi:hypothetical protein